jgi:hypothetical protein
LSSVSVPVADLADTRIVKRVFSFPVAIASLLVVLAVLTVRSRFDDPDMWWHLRAGQIIWTTHTIPTTDLFSFTAIHHTWIPHEWLSQTLIFAAYHWAGFTGLMLWLCLFVSAIFIAGYILCSLYSGNSKVSFLGALIIFIFATVGISIRPQVIGYLLLILELLCIHLGRSRTPRWFWLLPPLFALWINCHGSFFLGIVVACLFLFSSYVQFQWGSLTAERWNPSRRRTFLIALALSVAALFLNPIGIKQILLPLDFLLHQNINLGIVQEWQPLVLSSQRGILFMVVLGCCFLLAIIRKSELRFDELLLLALGAWMAGSHDRMLFVFGILAAPILSRMCATSWEGYNPAADRIWPNAMLIGLALLVSVLAFPSAKNLAAQAEKNSPVQAVEFIKANHLSGPMMNDYAYGGYLIWAMPEHPVFIDGRAEVYEWAGVLGQFRDWLSLQSNPNTLLDQYNIQFCLLTPNAPMAHVLPSMHWKTIYSDSNAVIFIRPAAAKAAP